MSSRLDANAPSWPGVVLKQPWPKDGVSYIYEHRGYVRPDKLKYWLGQAFPGKAKCVVFNERIYVKAPRRPDDVSFSFLPSWFVMRCREGSRAGGKKGSIVG
jgi:hypothetical protein